MWDLPPLEEFGMESQGLVVASPWPVMVRGCSGQAQSGACVGDTVCIPGRGPAWAAARCAALCHRVAPGRTLR